MAGILEGNGSYNPVRRRDSSDPRAPLSKEDFVDGNVQLPVSQVDYDNRKRLLQVIYLCNRSGLKLALAGTSQGTSNPRQNICDPTNYLMEWRVSLGNSQYTKIKTKDQIEVVWRYQLKSQSGNRWINNPGVIVMSPNNKTALFRKLSQGVEMEVTEDARAAPNSFAMDVENDDLIVEVSIYKHFEIGNDFYRSPEAIRSFTLTNTSDTAEYVHVLKYKIWAFAELEEQQGREIAPTSGIDYTQWKGEREGGDTFRVGDDKWKDVLFDVRPGSYVVALVKKQGGWGAVELAATQTTNDPHVVPAPEYIISE